MDRPKTQWRSQCRWLSQPTVWGIMVLGWYKGYITIVVWRLRSQLVDDVMMMVMVIMKVEHLTGYWSIPGQSGFWPFWPTFWWGVSEWTRNPHENPPLKGTFHIISRFFNFMFGVYMSLYLWKFMIWYVYHGLTWWHGLQGNSNWIIPDQGSATCFSRASPHWGTVTRGKKKLMLTFPVSPTSRRMSLKLLKLKSRERSWIWGLKIKRQLPQVILTLIVQYVSSQCISVYVPFAGRFHCFGKGQARIWSLLELSYHSQTDTWFCWIQ